MDLGRLYFVVKERLEDRKMKNASLISFVLLLAISTSALAATRWVPAEYDAIQAARKALKDAQKCPINSLISHVLLDKINILEGIYYG